MARYACGRGVSQRRACALLSTPRSGLGYRSKRERADRGLARALKLISGRHPAWGYRLVGAVLRLRGWTVNDKRVYRLWRALGLTLPPCRARRKIRTGDSLDRPARKRNDVWALDFVHDSYGEGQKLRCLTIKDEATGYCLAIEVAVSLRHGDVERVLRGLIARYGRPKAIRSDNGPEFVAHELQEAMKRLGVRCARITPGKPWQNGSNESFNGTFRRECLDAELFGSLLEAQVIISRWRETYNRQRPHSSHGYQTPETMYFGPRPTTENLSTLVA